MEFEKYHKGLSYSYSFGAFGTIELLKNKNCYCKAILIDPSFVKNETYKKIVELCKERNIPIVVNLQTISKIRDKDNIYVVGVFDKYQSLIDNNKHILLYRINDVGIVGTIIRSMDGFNFHNLILIDCDIDIFDEHLVRSSMGSFFKTNIKQYDNLDSYLKDYPNKQIVSISKHGDTTNLDNKDYTYAFSNDYLDYPNVINYCFNRDISIDNIANIVLFTLYEGKSL